ncbi:MAG: LacI family DNA-binding transcriptional regulator [Acidimicrobiales bacterium]
MTNSSPYRRVPTLNDVAARAGVSPKTVSRALNNEGNVRPDKVAKVLAAASELGFKPNEFARLLRTRGKSSIIGVVTADVGDPFWSGVLRGIEVAVSGGDRFILSASTRDRSDREAEIVSAMVERRVMALLIVPTTDDQSHLAAVTAAGTPVVCVDRPARRADVDAVVADDIGGAERGIHLLLDHGHRRIAFLATPSIHTTGQRLIGYRKALSAAGIREDERLVDAAIPGADLVEPVVRRMLALDEPPTAVFAANVAMSIGVLALMRPLHWAPAMIAFSDFDAARIADPMVTVVDNDPVLLGRRAAELALERLDGYAGPPRLVRLDTPLVIRESHAVVATVNR